ncbi:S41 family peptidase [Ramlibacter tataouinensis]|uniref:S41 family peptidase n=1 Tax=Ramlibacter tataouinensis TaxID=94132 RepID=UPI0022F39670|nr:S41 family peptidase [Ramlibacter tataouinensis]WBY03664.1 S41 family peptidase [Ramlibacter tataouinensis]
MFRLAPLRRAAAVAAAFSIAFLLAACGGGGGSGPDLAAGALSSRGLFPESSSLAGMCSLADQQRWLRAYMDEKYLWNDEVPEVRPADYGTMPAYFDALLVRTSDADGLARDRFSTSMSSRAADVMQGVASASAAVADYGSSRPVPLVRTILSTGSRKVGYILFNEHSKGAQDALIGAFGSLRDAGVQDLVLDLRYNGGGFLYIAQAAAAMVAGPSIEGQVFESVRYNSHRSAENAAGTFIFSTRVLTGETTYGRGHPLPQLKLPRLYVLTSQLTCSASESIVNSLRGIGVQVVLIGDRTCGKPYGFHRKDNCGQAYFPIEFQVYNAQGYGDYTAGFPVQCRVQENPRTALGAVDEPLLAAALTHIDTGRCPVAGRQLLASPMLQQSPDPSPLDRPEAPPADSPMYQPGWNGRVLQP